MKLQLQTAERRNKVYKYLYLWVLLCIPAISVAQSDSIKYDIRISGLTSSGNYSPFWLQSNQFGKVSSLPSSANLFAGISKDYTNSQKLFDYGFKASTLIQTDQSNTSIYFHELFAKARFSFIDLTIGAREEQLGNEDSTLTSGGLIFSRNARPMPKVTIGIDRFTPVPFTFNFLEIKGRLSHGWFTDNIYSTGVLLHHKSLYARIGGKLPVHFQYGLDHVAQWGGNVPGYGQQPSGLKDLYLVFKGSSGGTDASSGEQINALGNHIISQSMRLDVDVKDFKIAAYWQNISEDNPIRFIGNTNNVADGLWGITIKNRKFPYVKGILYEYLNTTDQSGPYHDKDGIVYGGMDSYFYNYVYNSGWSYYSRIIGTPFITSAIYNTDGSVSTSNNRVQVHHFGIEGDISGYNYKALTSFSKNYGTYSTPKDIKNTSALLEINKQFPKFANIEFSCSLGADFGQFYGNSVGLLFSIRKRGNIFSY